MGAANYKKSGTKAGFTIVEMAIVITVIAILAAISVVSYSGIRGRANDAQRKNDVRLIAQALERYYLDNNRYPDGLCTSSCVINGGWSTTNDGSWINLANQLVPKYLPELPSDPNPGTANPQAAGVYGYGYFETEGGYCGTGSSTYILIYTLESSSQQNTLIGSCTSPTLGPYANASNYRVTTR